MAEGFDHDYPALYYEEVSDYYNDQLPIPEDKTPKKMELNTSPITEGVPEAEIAGAITIDVNEVKFSTDRAWLLDTEAGEAWFPKSQCNLDEEHMAVTLPQWLFDRKF